MTALVITTDGMQATRIPMTGAPVATEDRTAIILGFEGTTAVTLDLRHATAQWLDDLIVAVRDVATRAPAARSGGRP